MHREKQANKQTNQGKDHAGFKKKAPHKTAANIFGEMRKCGTSNKLKHEFN